MSKEFDCLVNDKLSTLGHNVSNSEKEDSFVSNAQLVALRDDSYHVIFTNV